MVLNKADCQLLFGKIMHHRFIPRENKFLYSMFYVNLNSEHLNDQSGNWLLGINKPALLSIYAKDHGDKQKTTRQWQEDALRTVNINDSSSFKITLITLPRVFGFVFNPVSFWMCRDEHNELRAVICEVNNTFGERHTYICTNENNGPISAQDVITAHKVFHVSPFLEREGHYQFQFSYDDRKFAAIIDYYNDENKKMLGTSVVGAMQPANALCVLRAIFLYPLATLQVVFLIHWQALKIFIKGISYVPKPIQHEKNITQSHSEELRG